MKRILFCLIVTLTFSRPTFSCATDLNPAPKIENVQHESPVHQEDIQKSTGDYFYNDLLAPAEDDTNDPKGENFSAGTDAAETFYPGSQDFYKLRLKTIRYNGYFFPQRSLVFILHQVFRL